MNNEKFKEKKNLIANPWIWIVSILLCGIGIGFVLIAVLLGLIIYSKIYFKGENFEKIRTSIVDYINECNELNQHIEELRSSYVNAKKQIMEKLNSRTLVDIITKKAD